MQPLWIQYLKDLVCSHFLFAYWGGTCSNTAVVQLRHLLLSLCSPGQPRIITSITPQPYWRSGWLSCKSFTTMLSGDQWTSPRKSENVNVLNFMPCCPVPADRVWIKADSPSAGHDWQAQPPSLFRRSNLKGHRGSNKINWSYCKCLNSDCTLGKLSLLPRLFSSTCTMNAY